MRNNRSIELAAVFVILSGSGGMGSLNDLVLGQSRDASGNFQWKDGYGAMNEQFQRLFESLYAFAHTYRRAASAAAMAKDSAAVTTTTSKPR